MLPLPSTCCRPAALAPPLSARDLSQQLPHGKGRPGRVGEVPWREGSGGNKRPRELFRDTSGAGGGLCPRGRQSPSGPLFRTQAAPSPVRPLSLERSEEALLSPWRLQRDSPLTKPSFPASLHCVSPFCIKISTFCIKISTWAGVMGVSPTTSQQGVRPRSLS